MTRAGTENLVKVLGILSLCFSVFCICGNLGGVFGTLMTSSFQPVMEQAQSRMRAEIEREIAELEKQRDESDDTAEQERLSRRIEELRERPDPGEMMAAMVSPEQMRFGVISVLTGLATNLVLLVGGVGLLLMAGWGRWVSLLAAVLKMVNIIAVSLINLVFYMPRQFEAMQKMMDSMPKGAGGPPAGLMTTFITGWGTAWVIISMILVCLYPVALLILLNLKDVRRLLSGRWPWAEAVEGEDDLAPRRLREY